MSAQRDDAPGIPGTWLRARGGQDLAPDPAAIDRIGKEVTATFVRTSRARDERRPAIGMSGPARHGEHCADHPTHRRAIRPHRWRIPPLVAASFAVALVVVAVAGPTWVFAAESQPGRPLYSARLVAETIGLPTAGTSARAVAEVERLGRRVAEVRQEAAAGDWDGAAAALGAAREAADALQRALAAAPDARGAVRPGIHAARRALAGVATDARAPRSVREAARTMREALEEPAGHRTATGGHGTASGGR